MHACMHQCMTNDTEVTQSPAIKPPIHACIKLEQTTD